MDTWLEYRDHEIFSYDPMAAMNGCLCGLVAITAGCAVVTPWAAVVVGLVAGMLVNPTERLLERRKVDDVVSATPVHMVGGICGLLAVGLFAEEQRLEMAGYRSSHTGWFYSWGKGSGDARLLLAQFVAIIWIIVWTSSLMAPFFYLIQKLNLFRVSPEAEVAGLDLSFHGGYGYDVTDSAGSTSPFVLSSAGGASKDPVDEVTARRASMLSLDLPKLGSSKELKSILAGSSKELNLEPKVPSSDFVHDVSSSGAESSTTEDRKHVGRNSLASRPRGQPKKRSLSEAEIFIRQRENSILHILKEDLANEMAELDAKDGLENS